MNRDAWRDLREVFPGFDLDFVPSAALPCVVCRVSHQRSERSILRVRSGSRIVSYSEMYLAVGDAWHSDRMAALEGQMESLRGKWGKEDLITPADKNKGGSNGPFLLCKRNLMTFSDERTATSWTCLAFLYFPDFSMVRSLSRSIEIVGHFLDFCILCLSAKT